jgi:hypothetical protein
MGYFRPEKEYKADYYINNIELYRERNRLYREKQKAIRDGTYIPPIKPIKIPDVIEEKVKIKKITVYFL